MANYFVVLHVDSFLFVLGRAKENLHDRDGQGGLLIKPDYVNNKFF